MKKPLIFPVLLLIMIQSFGQTIDSLTIVNKNYMSNIQGGIFAPVGLFALQFEHAVSKKISLNLLTQFNYPYLSKNHPTDYSLELMPQLRWYTQKKKGYNQGFYISVSANAIYDQSYTYGSYNPQTNDIRLNSTYLPSGYYYEENISRQRFSIYMGAGAGYQWLLAKRLIVDVGYSVQYVVFGRERFQNIPVQNEWQKVDYNDIFSYLHYSLQANVGYAF